MKTKQKWILFLLTLFFAVLNLNNYAATQEENRKVTGFDAIHITSGIDLFLSMGNTEKVTVVADDDIIDDIVTEVKNGTLKIYLKRRFFRFC